MSQFWWRFPLPGKWTRSDSNRRSSPCKGDAFPLGHGPLPGHAVVPTRGLEPPHLAAIDPKSIASANSATSAYLPQCDHNYSARSAVVQIQGNVVLPILFTATCATALPSSISAWSGRPYVVCQALPDAPVPLRRDSTPSPAGEHAEPTHLAPSCTLAQPAPLLAPLVGSYPTLSPLTALPRRVCSLLRL
jgi:hypothetical protein